MSIVTIVLVFLALSMIQQSTSQISIEPARPFALSEGESLTLHCIIRNPLYTRVEWFLDKTQLSLNSESYNSDYTVDQSATDNNGLPQYSLSCPSVTKENAGKYKCKAFRQGRSPAKSVLEVDVYYTPAHQYPICYYRANTSSLHCESEKGNPLIELQWSRVSSNVTSDVMSTNSDGGRFTHTEIVRVEELPKPLSANDSLFCSFQTEQHRNCTISYIEIFDTIQPPVLQTEEPSVLVGENVSLTCNVTNYFTDSVIAFSYVTSPTDASLCTEQVNDTITFIEIPPSVKSISVNCFLKWGMLQSVSSTVSNISVVHPSTQPPSSTEDQPVRGNTTLTVSLSTQSSQTDLNAQSSSVGGMITSKATSAVMVTTSDVTLQTQTPTHIPTNKTPSSSSTSYLAREMDTSIMLTDQKTINLADNNTSSSMETTTTEPTVTTDINKTSSEVISSSNSTRLSPPPESTSSSLLPPTPPSPPPLLPPSMNKDPHLGTTFGSSTGMEIQSLTSTSVPQDMKTTDVVRRKISSSTQKSSTLPGSTLPPSSSKLPPTTPSSSSSLIIGTQLSSTHISNQAMETSYLKSTSLSTSMKTTEIASSTVSSSTSSPGTTPLPSSFPANPTSDTFLPPVTQTVEVEGTSSSTSKRTNAYIFADSTRASPQSTTNIATTTGTNIFTYNSTYVFQKKYFIPLIAVALLLIVVGTTAALLYARRRCTEHGQYRVVTKMIWVNNGTSTAVPLKEIHI